MVDPNARGIKCRRTRICPDELRHTIAKVCSVWNWKSLQKRLGGWNCRLPRAERGDSSVENPRQKQAQSFVRKEEESAIPSQRTTKDTAEIVLPELRFRKTETVGEP